MTMTKLFNCTGHSQEAYASTYAEMGWEIEVEPRVQRVPASEMEAEGKRVAASIPPYSHVLVGGAQVITEAASLDLLEKGCRIYAALTERESSPDGGFVFNLRGVSETPLSKWWTQ